MQAMLEGLGDKFIGTSNCAVARERDIEAIGTNAHELPMVYCALAETDDQLAAAPYHVLSDWQEEHDGNLRVILPDTYGTEAFYKKHQIGLAAWTGVRIDSGDPAAVQKLLLSGGRIAAKIQTQKLVIFSDGLDTESIINLHRKFSGRIKVSFGWGTNLTNDFRALYPMNSWAHFLWCVRPCQPWQANCQAFG